MHSAKFILKYLVSLLYDPEQTWTYLEREDLQESKPDYVMSNYFYPWLGFSALLVFLIAGLHTLGGDKDFFEVAMRTTIPYVLSYAIGPFVTIYISRLVLSSHFVDRQIDAGRMQVFVAFCTSILMLVHVVAALVPTIRFIDFANLYLIYIVWCGATGFVHAVEKHRLRFSLLFTLLLWASPRVIVTLLSFMQRS